MANRPNKTTIPPCPANQMSEMVKDAMWYFLMRGGQQANIPALEEAVNELCHAMMQKTGGQAKYAKSGDVDFKNLDWIMWRIVIEATALVLSGELDKLKGTEDRDDKAQ